LVQTKTGILLRGIGVECSQFLRTPLFLCISGPYKFCL